MKIGYAQRNITPSPGTVMCAFPKKTPARKVPREDMGCRDSLNIRALIMDEGDSPVAIVSCDLILWQTCDALEIREMAQQLSGNRIAANHIQIACTHTHSSFENTYLFSDTPDMALIASTKLAVAQLICEALDQMDDAEVYFSQIDAPYNHNRRVIENDSVILVGDRDDRTDGQTDPTLSLMRFDRKNGQTVFWINWTGHPLTLGPGNSQFSSDYPGRLIDMLTDRFPGSSSLFTNGCAGNIHPFKSMKPDDEATMQVAVLLAEKVVEANTQASKLETNKLHLDYDEVCLVHRDSQDVEITVPIACLTIGNLKIGFLPGEPFVEFQLSYRDQMLPNLSFVNGYSNGWHGYMPTAKAYVEGGYGADFFPGEKPEYGRTQIKPGDGERIVDELIKLSKKR